jgi:FixJ family two-component response regulator
MKASAVDFLPKAFRDQDMIDAVTAASFALQSSSAVASPGSALSGSFSFFLKS